jgi:hypothetical protein
MYSTLNNMFVIVLLAVKAWKGFFSFINILRHNLIN